MTTALTLQHENIDSYVAEINKYPLLTREQELDLAQRYREFGDITAAHKLVVSNLRFVVKVAHQYRGYGFSLTDLIQEGNIGLMIAVKKFDPAKGYRLISYAVWWIKAQIRAYIVKSWSLVKLGTTYAQRKLFFSRRALAAGNDSGGDENGGHDRARRDLAKELGIETSEVAEIEMRMAARDFSLDSKLSDDSRISRLEAMTNPEQQSQEDALVQREQQHILLGKVDEALENLNEKERYIVEKRLLQDEPETLQAIGDRFQVSRERVRQLENRVMTKLRSALEKANRQMQPAEA